MSPMRTTDAMVLLALCSASLTACGSTTEDSSSTPPASSSPGGAGGQTASGVGQAAASTGEVVGKKMVNGKTAYEVQSLCPGAGIILYAEDGDRVEVYSAGEWKPLLDTPVEAARSWTDGSLSFH